MDAVLGHIKFNNLKCCDRSQLRSGVALGQGLNQSWILRIGNIFSTSSDTSQLDGVKASPTIVEIIDAEVATNHNAIIALIASNGVATCAGIDRVVTGETSNGVITGKGIQYIVTSSTIQGVFVGTASNGIVAIIADNGVGTVDISMEVIITLRTQDFDRVGTADRDLSHLS